MIIRKHHRNEIFNSSPMRYSFWLYKYTKFTPSEIFQKIFRCYFSTYYPRGICPKNGWFHF